MTSEIRTNSLTSRAGLSTVTLTDSGPMFSGITTFVDNSGFNLGTGSSIFTPASNTLTFGTNSTERLRINSSGSVAIGTDSPTGNALTLGGTAAAVICQNPNSGYGSNQGFYFGNGNGTIGYVWNYENDQIRFATNNTERLRIGSSGQIGLSGANYGTSGQVLTSGGSGSAATWSTVSGTTINNNADNRLITGSGSANTLNAESNVLYDGTNFGIGKSPSRTLDVQGKIRSSDSVCFGDNSSTPSEGAAIHRPAASTLAFVTNDTERVRIASNGGVGIATDKIPRNYFLHIAAPSQDYTNTSTQLPDGGGIMFQHTDTLASTGRTYPGIFWSGNTSALGRARAGIIGVTASNNDATHIAFLTRIAANGTSFYPSDERFRIKSDGHLKHTGLRSGNNENKLAILTTPSYNTSEEDVAFYIAENESGMNQITFGGGTSSYNAATNIRFLTASAVNTTIGTERLRIDSSGNVIIRGSSLNNSSVSGQALQINGTTRPTLILRGNASGGNTCEIQFADNSGTDSDPGTRVGLIKYEHAGTYADHMHFHTSGTERVVISHNGRFGVANSPAELAAFAENLQVTGLYGNQYAAAFKIKQSSGSLMRFATWVNASSSFQLCGGITVNGTSTSFNTSSDYRLKENDIKISDGITRVKQLRPIRFNWKSDSSSTEDGFFAHEVSPVVPESVTGEKDAEINEIGEGYQKIDHSKLVPLLTAALQEAITKIEKLEQDNIALRARVTNLEGN